MNWKFWKKVDINSVEKKKKQLAETFSDKVALDRINRISKTGTKLICVKNTCLDDYPDYDNFAEFIENKDKVSYLFEEGDICEVSYIRNEYINVSTKKKGSTKEQRFCVIPNYDSTYYIFDVFKTQAEITSLHRDSQINNVLEL